MHEHFHKAWAWAFHHMYIVELNVILCTCFKYI